MWEFADKFAGTEEPMISDFKMRSWLLHTSEEKTTTEVMESRTIHVYIHNQFWRIEIVQHVSRNLLPITHQLFLRNHSKTSDRFLHSELSKLSGYQSRAENESMQYLINCQRTRLHNHTLVPLFSWESSSVESTPCTYLGEFMLHDPVEADPANNLWYSQEYTVEAILLLIWPVDTSLAERHNLHTAEGLTVHPKLEAQKTNLLQILIRVNWQIVRLNTKTNGQLLPSVFELNLLGGGTLHSHKIRRTGIIGCSCGSFHRVIGPRYKMFRARGSIRSDSLLRSEYFIDFWAIFFYAEFFCRISRYSLVLHRLPFFK